MKNIGNWTSRRFYEPVKNMFQSRRRTHQPYDKKQPDLNPSQSTEKIDDELVIEAAIQQQTIKPDELRDNKLRIDQLTNLKRLVQKNYIKNQKDITDSIAEFIKGRKGEAKYVENNRNTILYDAIKKSKETKV